MHTPRHLHAAHPIQVTENVGTPTVKDLSAFLQENMHPAYEFIANLAEAGTKIPAMSRHTGRFPESAEALGTLMVVALATQVVDVPADPSRIRFVKEDVLNQLCHVAYALRTDREVAANPSLSARQRTQRDLPRIFGIQGMLDADPSTSVGRFALLVGRTSDATWSLPQDSSFAHVVFEEFGCSLDELSAGAFTAWLVASRNAVFHIDRLFDSFPDPQRTTLAFQLLLRRASLSVAAAKAVLADELADLPPMAQAFDLFTRYPFLDLGAGWFMATPHPYARFFLPHRLFYATRFAARQQGGSRHGPDDNAVSRIFGERFERYCFETLALGLPTFSAYSEHPYASKGDAKSPDGVFLDPSGSECVILQVKLRMPTRGLLLADPGDERVRDYEDVYARMIDQTVRYLMAIERAGALNGLNQQTAEISKRVLSAKRLTFLCLCPAVPQIVHLPPFEPLLRAALERQLKPEALEWYRQQRNRGRIATVHIDHVGTIEYLSANPTSSPLPVALRTWRKAVQLASERVKRPGQPPMVPASFVNYLKIRRVGQPALRPPRLVQAFNELNSHVNALLGGDILTDSPSDDTDTGASME